MNYLDFEIEIGPGMGRDYAVAIIDSPAGEARSTMRFPFDELELENRLQALQIALLRSGGRMRRLLSPEEQSVRDFGQRLFEALLADELRSRYDVSLREAARLGAGLRIKLRIQSPELAALPWEFLFDPRQEEYVCLSRSNPIVRYLEVPQPLTPMIVQLPLRILGMIAAPQDLSHLDIPREKQRVETAINRLRTAGLVELSWLPGETWRDLQRALQGGPWHVFHFIGHGGFDPNTDEGLIALSNEQGLARLMNATQLGRLLADHSSLRLIVLNSCEGARGSERDVFSSAASILVRRGIPAVIAMQYEITDLAAIEFARAFYEALANGMPVDAAVTEARKAISLAVNNTIEWGTPVLYLRAPDGRIFDLPERPPSETPSPLPAAAPSEDPRRAERLKRWYDDANEAFWLDNWAKAAELFQQIIDEAPEYRDAAVKLEQANRNAHLLALYERAVSAQDARDWAVALEALQALVNEEPHYEDAAVRLEVVSVQAHLASLYAEAEQLHAAEKWQAVVNVFADITASEPEYPDPLGLFTSAQREIAAQEHHKRLEDLYSQALEAMDKSQWQEAHRALLAVQELETAYRETEQLLARVEAEIQRQAEERQKRNQIQKLYEQGREMVRVRQWQKALETMEAIQAIDPQFEDPEGVARRAKEELAHKAEEEQRRRQQEEETARKQAELSYLYTEAAQLLEVGRYQEALEKWSEVRSRDPAYPDRMNIQSTARKELERLARTPSGEVWRPGDLRRRLGGRGWWWLAIPLVLALGLYLSSQIDLPGISTTTPTVTPAGEKPAGILWDESGVVKPSVLKDGSTHWMWFDGKDASQRSQIGAASSQDGLSWQKVDGNPVMTFTPGAWDEGGEHAPFVLKDDGVFKMWYEGSRGGQRQLGYATSTDGIFWRKNLNRPVLRNGPQGFDQEAAGHGSVLKDGNTYQLWYHAKGDQGPIIAYAVSSDGIQWNKRGPVLTPDPENWDADALWGPTVLKLGQEYWMWYTGFGPAGTGIGVATSFDGVNWNRFLDFPVVKETFFIGDPHVIDDQGKLVMWYSDLESGSIYYAESTDGINWKKPQDGPILRPGSP